MFCIWVVSWKDWKNTITIPIFDQRSNIYAILLMPNLIFNLEWTLGICVGPSPITSFWVLALVRYISTFGNLGIWWDFKNVGSSPIYTSVGPSTDPRPNGPARAKILPRFQFEGKTDLWISQVRCVKGGFFNFLWTENFFKFL